MNKGNEELLRDFRIHADAACCSLLIVVRLDYKTTYTPNVGVLLNMTKRNFFKFELFWKSKKYPKNGSF